MGGKLFREKGRYDYIEEGEEVLALLHLAISVSVLDEDIDGIQRPETSLFGKFSGKSIERAIIQSYYE